MQWATTFVRDLSIAVIIASFMFCCYFIVRM